MKQEILERAKRLGERFWEKEARDELYDLIQNFLHGKKDTDGSV